MRTSLFLLILATASASALELPVAQPTRGEIIRYVTLPGKIRANQQATLYAKVPGYLKTLGVDTGDAVAAGQELGEIETPELISELAKYEAELKVAQTDYDRVSTAREKAPDLVIPQTVDDAEGRVEIAKANIEHMTTMLRYSKLSAPFAGIVTARHVDPGAFIPAATSGGTAQTAAILDLMDFSIIRVEIPVPEIEAPLVQKGQPVLFTVDSLKGQSFEATVSRFAFALDPSTQTMRVEADLANPEFTLRPGMYCTVRLGVERHEDALRIPADALLVEKGGSSVFLHQAGLAKKMPVKSGFNDGTLVEILEGLEESQTVIRFGTTPLTDGQAVAITEMP